MGTDRESSGRFFSGLPADCWHRCVGPLLPPGRPPIPASAGLPRALRHLLLRSHPCCQVSPLLEVGTGSEQERAGPWKRCCEKRLLGVGGSPGSQAGGAGQAWVLGRASPPLLFPSPPLSSSPLLPPSPLLSTVLPTQGRHVGYTEVPRPGLNWTCSCKPAPQARQHQIPATAVVYRGQQRRILNLLSEARDQTCLLMDTSQIHFGRAAVGIPVFVFYPSSHVYRQAAVLSGKT